MSKIDLNGCCVCLESNAAIESIYTPDEMIEVPPSEMLAEVTGVQMEEDCYSDLKICHACGLSLIQAYKFRLKALQAQKQIMELIKQQEDISLNSEKEIDMRNIDEESILEPLLVDCDHQEEEYDALWETSTIAVPPKTITKKRTKRNRSTKKATESAEHKKQQKNKTASHICDICGNIYIKRSRLMEHRQRHNKELRYACEFCDKRFYLRELLRRHTLTHSGSKPFKCSYCSRTFFYLSAKKAHEAIHSGHKPYSCDICHKTFAYSQSLKKHELIHAEIKLYHCIYCNKEFRLQHHMKQHEETKMHQKALATAMNATKSNEQ